MYEKYCVLHGFSKSRSVFVKKIVFRQNEANSTQITVSYKY